MTAAFVPLATLLAAGRPAAHVVAIHGGRHRSWAEFTSRVAGLARLVLLDHRGEARLAALAVPTPEGMAVLQRDGRRGLGTTLRRWLEPHWDRVLVPRVWRFVDRLPEDAQGKTSVAELQALFRSSVGR